MVIVVLVVGEFAREADENYVIPIPEDLFEGAIQC
jgi:hypothetical protein